jgi:hypothetical protein
MGGQCKTRTLECEYCLELFDTNVSPSKKRRFCSRKCSNNSRIDTVQTMKDKSKLVNGCLIWQGCINDDGYGTISHKGKQYKVHRLAYILEYGEVPDGMVVMHRCDMPSCFHIDHLVLGTVKDNVIDMARKDRHGKISLKRKVVSEIVERYNNGELGKDLAEEYGIARSTVSRYINGRRRNV